jgi:hypothetical protein
VRGRSIACVVMDKVAFWRSETTANPDTETYQAVMPSLATIAGSMLIGISTPYRRSGLLYTRWKDFSGQDDDDVLVVHGASRAFNPTLPEKIVEDALKRDAAAARAEWLAEWRDDIAAFLSPELIESAIDRGVTVRSPVTPSATRAAGWATASRARWRTGTPTARPSWTACTRRPRPSIRLRRRRRSPWC